MRTDELNTLKIKWLQERQRSDGLCSKANRYARSAGNFPFFFNNYYCYSWNIIAALLLVWMQNTYCPLLFLLCFVFRNEVLLYDLGWPGTQRPSSFSLSKAEISVLHSSSQLEKMLLVYFDFVYFSVYKASLCTTLLVHIALFSISFIFLNFLSIQKNFLGGFDIWIWFG